MSVKALWKVEAAMFSVGRPVEIQDIQNSTGLTRPTVRSALRALQNHHEDGDGSLAVVESGGLWSLQVKPQYVQFTRKLADPAVQRHLLRTAALIAYHQPMMQSDLVQMAGPRVYDHVRDLKEKGLIRSSREGRSYKLTITKDFPQAFGLQGKNQEQLKKELNRLLKKRKELAIEDQAAVSPEAVEA